MQGEVDRVSDGENCLSKQLVNWLIMATLGGLAWVPLADAPALAPDKAFHQYVRDVWSIEEGLPQITVNAVAQGPRGYIWVATQAGIARFDGVRFSVFHPANSPEIPGIFVRDLMFDRQGRLWIGTYKGAANYHEGEFRTVDDGFGRDIDIFQFAESDDGEILVASARGLLRERNGVLMHVGNDPEQPVRSVGHGRGVTMVGGFGEIFRHQDGRWHREALPEDLGSALVGDFAHYDGTWWAATSKGLLFLDRGEWRRHPLGAERDDLVIEVLYADRDGNFWVGAAGRLLRLDGRELVEVVADDAPESPSSVLSMAEDHEGNLWLGSRWEGLTRMWNGWVLRYDRPEGLHNSLVWSVARDGDGNIWTGTIDGLAVFRNGRFEQLTDGADQPHPHAYTLLPEPQRVWVGTRTGLFIWDRGNREIVRPEGFASLDGIQINGIVKRGSGDYWLATTDGVWRWNGESMTRLADRDDPGGQDARVLLITSTDEVLLGTRKGVFRFEDEHGFRQLDDVAEDQDVTALFELSDGRLVAGTMDERLWVQNQQGWLEFGEEHGIPATSVWAFGEHDGVLWVGGIRGIYELELAAIDEWMAGRIDRLPGRMVLHERGDVPGAQQGYCCNGAGNAKGFMHDGEFWLPSRGGVVHLVPEHVVRNEQPPNVVVDLVRVDGSWRLVKPDEALELNPEQRDVAFRFSVLSFQDPGSVQLRYRLAGFDNDWQLLDESMQRQAFYTNLPAGSYTLEIEGSNNAGVWSEQPARLDVSVARKFWETPIFQLILLVAVLTVIWLGFNFRFRRLQHQQGVLERTIAERTEELRRANEELRDYSSRMETVSLTDPLTGLWNRRYLLQQLPSDLSHFHRELARGSENGQIMLMGVCAIDRLRRLNHRHSHAAGDAVLRQVSELLRDLVRRGDYLVRWGGDDFLFVFRPMSSNESVRIAKRVVAAVRRHRFELPDGTRLSMTASFGLAEYPPYRDQPGAFSWEDTVRLAERAVEFVRSRGRDGWCLVSPAPWVEPAALIDRLGGDLQTLLDAEQVRVRTGAY